MKFPTITLILTLIAIGVSITFGFAAEAWVYDREAIAQGEWWRLLTGHFVHSDLAHAQWDILAFAIVGTLLEQWGHRMIVIATLGSILTIDIWLWWGLTDLHYYCGLSGIINALLGLLLIQLWQERSQPILVLVTAIIISKVLIEMAIGQALFTHTLWPSVPSVHLVGLLFASVLGSLTIFPRQPLRSLHRKVSQNSICTRTFNAHQ